MTPGRLHVRFRLFWLTGVRNLMTHRLRVVLSAVGIAAGVALAVGVGAISSSIDASVRSVSQAAAAFADIEVRPPADVGMPAEILEEVRATEGVLEAGATIESVTLLRTADQEVRALVLGVDAGIASMAPPEGDVRLFEDGNPLGLYLSPLLSTELGIRSAGEVEVNTTGGWRPLPIAGLLPDDGPVTRAAIGPIGTLQDLSKQDGRVDAIYVQTNEPDAVVQRLEVSIGDRTLIGAPGFTSSIAQQLAGLVTMLFGGAATISLFVGAFLVYNTMSMAAATRRKETALLRAVGARKGQLFRSFCAEGLVIGAVGALAGLALGVILARALFVGQSSLLVEVFPLRDGSPQFRDGGHDPIIFDGGIHHCEFVFHDRPVPSISGV
jgi:putative ABC transport system permease protein